MSVAQRSSRPRDEPRGLFSETNNVVLGKLIKIRQWDELILNH